MDTMPTSSWSSSSERHQSNRARGVEEKGSNNKVTEHRARRKKRVLFLKLLRLGLAANVTYLIGASSFVAFSALELNGRDRSVTASATYITAFVCFFLSGIVELAIDVFSERTVRHGRYTTRHRLNMVISLLFVLGTILDLVAFFLWDGRYFLEEHRVLYASSHTWLATAVVVLVGQAAEMDASDFREGLDGCGNVLFFAGTLIDCVVRYVDNPGAPHPEEPVARLEFSSSPIWLASAICYVVADAMRLLRPPAVENDLHLHAEAETSEDSDNC